MKKGDRGGFNKTASGIIIPSKSTINAIAKGLPASAILGTLGHSETSNGIIIPGGNILYNPELSVLTNLQNEANIKLKDEAFESRYIALRIVSEISRILIDEIVRDSSDRDFTRDMVKILKESLMPGFIA